MISGRRGRLWRGWVDKEGRMAHILEEPTFGGSCNMHHKCEDEECQKVKRQAVGWKKYKSVKMKECKRKSMNDFLFISCFIGVEEKCEGGGFMRRKKRREES